METKLSEEANGILATPIGGGGALGGNSLAAHLFFQKSNMVPQYRIAMAMLMKRFVLVSITLNLRRLQFLNSLKVSLASNDSEKITHT